MRLAARRLERRHLALPRVQRCARFLGLGLLSVQHLLEGDECLLYLADPLQLRRTAGLEGHNVGTQLVAALHQPATPLLSHGEVALVCFRLGVQCAALAMPSAHLVAQTALIRSDPRYLLAQFAHVRALPLHLL